MLSTKSRIACHLQIFVILCIISPLLTQKDSSQCEEGQVISVKNECWSYLQCLNGEIVKQQCVKGGYFDSDYEVCVIDANGTCSSPLDACLEGELRQDKNNCGGYLRCVKGELINELCAYGSYFHQVLKSCIVDEDGVCTSDSERCEEGVREEDLKDCTSYSECIDGDFMVQKCALGSYFNKSLKKCLVDINNECIQAKN